MRVKQTRFAADGLFVGCAVADVQARARSRILYTTNILRLGATRPPCVSHAMCVLHARIVMCIILYCDTRTTVKIAVIYRRRRRSYTNADDAITMTVENRDYRVRVCVCT